MDDVAQIAVVGRRCIAHHGIDLRRLGYGQFWSRIEPQRGFGVSAAFSRKIADDDEDSIPAPSAALASVLAISIAA